MGTALLGMLLAGSPALTKNACLRLGCVAPSSKCTLGGNCRGDEGIANDPPGGGALKGGIAFGALAAIALLIA